jgi:hypothetical protein
MERNPLKASELGAFAGDHHDPVAEHVKCPGERCVHRIEGIHRRALQGRLAAVGAAGRDLALREFDDVEPNRLAQPAQRGRREFPEVIRRLLEDDRLSERPVPGEREASRQRMRRDRPTQVEMAARSISLWVLWSARISARERASA